MPYTTEASMTAQFSKKELAELTQTDNIPEIDSAVLDRAIAEADAEIDSYLSLRFATPLTVVPGRIRDISGDIARYRLYDRTAPDMVAERYNNAIRDLIALRDGKLNLPGIVERSASDESPVVQFVESPQDWSRANRGWF